MHLARPTAEIRHLITGPPVPLDRRPRRVCPAIAPDRPRSGDGLQGPDCSHGATAPGAIPAQPGAPPVLAAIPRQRAGYRAPRSTRTVSLAGIISPADTLNSPLYPPVLEEFMVPGKQGQPGVAPAGAARDAREIRRYNRNRRIRGIIQVNRRIRNRPGRERSNRFYLKLY